MSEGRREREEEETGGEMCEEEEGKANDKVRMRHFHPQGGIHTYICVHVFVWRGEGAAAVASVS